MSDITFRFITKNSNHKIQVETYIFLEKKNSPFLKKQQISFQNKDSIRIVTTMNGITYCT